MDNVTLLQKACSLRARLKLALADCDEMELVEAAALRVEYTQKVGRLEFHQYRLYLGVQSLVRRIEEVQACLNAGESVDTIDYMSINDDIDTILNSHYEKLSGMAGMVVEADSYINGTRITKEEHREIKRLFRRLSKILHPDNCDRADEYDPMLWDRVKDAYKRNDLETLRLISDAIVDLPEFDPETASEEELEVWIARMERSLARTEQKMEDMKALFPFTEKEHLKDVHWVAERVDALEQSIGVLEQQLKGLCLAYLSLTAREAPEQALLEDSID